MNYLKYFKNTHFEENKSDCWTLVQEIFRDEHNIELPDHPISINNAEIASYLKENIKIKSVLKADKGCVVYYNIGNIHHAGYALNDKEFIHHTKKEGVRVDKIPQSAIIYKVLND